MDQPKNPKPIKNELGFEIHSKNNKKSPEILSHLKNK